MTADRYTIARAAHIMTYEGAEAYLLSVPRFTTKNTPEETKEFFTLLGNPGEEARIFHVAGTNGKGSVCAYIDSMARTAGYRTGMFTSPHLVTIRERFRLNGEMITREEFLQCFLRVRGELEEFCRQESRREYHPTFFEYLFFMGMVWFAEKKAEVIVLETGLGGRLDATNVIRNPEVCVITSIGRDHERYLGSTLEEIAGEKAGIIKEGCPVVYSRIRQEAAAIIEEKAAEKGCSCRGVEKVPVGELCFADKHIDFSLATRYYGNIRCRLFTTALYQPENAALAVAAVEEAGLAVGPKQMEEGLFRCHWAARMEEILPGVFLDGAHNEDGIDALLATAARDGSSRRWLLFSAAKDKDYRRMAAKIMSSGLFAEIYTALLQSERGLTGASLAALFPKGEGGLRESAEAALREILAKRGASDTVYIAGSLYLAGEIKAILEGRFQECNSRNEIPGRTERHTE